MHALHADDEEEQSSIFDVDDEDVEVEDGTKQPSVPFLVTVVKWQAEQSLRFNCRAYLDGSIGISNIQVEKGESEGDDNEEAAQASAADELEGDSDIEVVSASGVGEYSGPKFDQLDETLQEKFRDYLAVRLLAFPLHLDFFNPSGCKENRARERW